MPGRTPGENWLLGNKRTGFYILEFSGFYGI